MFPVAVAWSSLAVVRYIMYFSCVDDVTFSHNGPMVRHVYFYSGDGTRQA